MEPLLSVVVPVYQSEKFLRKCVGSILRQSYRNLEIILVDDGSTDGSPDLCDQFALIDRRVRVIHQINLGSAAARNRGIDACSGEYLAFADSDDWLEPEMYEVLMRAMLQTGSEIACCPFRPVDIRGNRIPGHRLPNLSAYEYRTGADCFVDFFNSRAPYLPEICNKIYLRSLFSSDLRYPIGKFHEGQFLTYRLYARASQTVLVPGAFYQKRNHPGAVSVQFGEEGARLRRNLVEAYLEFDAYLSTLRDALLSRASTRRLLITALEDGLGYLLLNDLEIKSDWNFYRNLLLRRSVSGFLRHSISFGELCFYLSAACSSQKLLSYLEEKEEESNSAS